MGFFQRIGNGLARFMYGRNGGDHLSITMMWSAVVLDVLNWFVKAPVVAGILGVSASVIFLVALFRIFSKNLERRRSENLWFLQNIWWPIKRKCVDRRQRRMDKEHKYFVCPKCQTMCRVPRGKGNIVISCPKCRNEIRGKS